MHFEDVPDSESNDSVKVCDVLLGQRNAERVHHELVQNVGSDHHRSDKRIDELDLKRFEKLGLIDLINKHVFETRLKIFF